MISQRNSRFTHLVFMVLLVAPAFMASTPAQGVFARAAARGAGMRRALPREMVYGFSLVDLIADNPWKSGLVATGVVALIVYLASGKVRNTVNNGVISVGDGVSWFGHWMKLQWKMRIKNYEKDDEAYRKLREDYALLGRERVASSAGQLRTAFDDLYDANKRLRESKAELDYFEKNRSLIATGSMSMKQGRAAVEEEQKRAKEEKESVALAAAQRPSKKDVQGEFYRLQNAYLNAAERQRNAQDLFNKKEREFTELDALMKSIARRGGYSEKNIGTFGSDTIALEKVEREREKVKKRIDDCASAGKVSEQADLDLYKELLKKSEKLEDELTEKQQKLKAHFSHASQSASSTSSASNSTASSTSSAVSETQSATVVGIEQPKADRILSASSSTLSSSSSAILASSSAS